MMKYDSDFRNKNYVVKTPFNTDYITNIIIYMMITHAPYLISNDDKYPFIHLK